jgi:hypothetical protein
VLAYSSGEKRNEIHSAAEHRRACPCIVARRYLTHSYFFQPKWAGHLKRKAFRQMRGEFQQGETSFGGRESESSKKQQVNVGMVVELPLVGRAQPLFEPMTFFQ